MKSVRRPIAPEPVPTIDSCAAIITTGTATAWAATWSCSRTATPACPLPLPTPNAASAMSTSWACGATSSSSRSMLTTASQTLGVGEGVRLAARHHHHLLAQRVLDEKPHDASAHVPRRAQQDCRVLRIHLCRSGCHRHVTRARNQKYTRVRKRAKSCCRAISSSFPISHSCYGVSLVLPPKNLTSNALSSISATPNSRQLGSIHACSRSCRSSKHES
jgi:hypothetical protein